MQSSDRAFPAVRLKACLAGAALVLGVAAACNPGASQSTSAASTSSAANPATAASRLPASTRSADLTVGTGVRGHVVAGPTCPVEMPAQSACVVSVTGAVIVARDSAGHEVGRTTSDNSGDYRLRLPPGTYDIVPLPIQWFMGGAPETTVTVTPGAPVQLDLEYDTGLR
jgi:hypothetical protein